VDFVIRNNIYGWATRGILIDIKIRHGTLAEGMHYQTLMTAAVG